MWLLVASYAWQTFAANLVTLAAAAVKCLHLICLKTRGYFPDASKTGVTATWHPYALGVASMHDDIQFWHPSEGPAIFAMNPDRGLFHDYIGDDLSK